MVIMILETVPASLRGQLTRWMIEPKAGVFIGNISAMVRQKLWDKACQGVREGGAILIHSAKNEQGFNIDFWGKTSRWITNWEGLQLVTRPIDP